MMSGQKRLGRWGFLVVALVGVLAALVQPARAADVDQLAGSLKWIPADAAYYATLLHCGSQWEAIVQSRAWAKLRALPAVQTARQKLQAELKEGGSLAQFYQVYQQPENQQLLALLGDMFSEEIFFYGGSNWAGFLELAGQLNAAQSYGPLLMLLSGQIDEANSNKMQLAMVLRTAANNLNLIRVPDLIIGFKLSDTRRAQDQLRRLDPLLAHLEAQVPPLKGRFKKEKLAGGTFLTVTVDGSMVPWQQLPIQDFELKPGEFDELIKKLGQLRLTLALGIRDGYLLLAIGESTGLLQTLGGGDKRLSERSELKPLAAHSGKRISSLAYVSQALVAQSQTSQLDGLIKLLHAHLPKLDLSAQQRDQMRKDLAELDKETKAAADRAGAVVALAFWSERGSEGYTYDYGKHPNLDGSKPLTLLNHVGGSPLFAIVSRSQHGSESYQKLVKILRVGYRYFEELAVPKFSEEIREKIEQITKSVRPLLRRLDEVTSTMLLPALGDGQGAIVVDAKLTSRQWFAQMPSADKPLPMLEPAAILGVSDAALLRKALGQYRSIFNELTTKVHEAAPDFPDLQIPEPESRNVQAGTLYFYPLPAEWGIDRQLAPTAGISNRVLALGISQKHAERLLASTPLKLDGGPLADLKKPRAMAVYFNWARTVRALTPWVEQGLRAAGIDPTEKVEAGDESWQGILKQIPAILEVLQVFRTYSSSSYFEGPVLVTHGEAVIKDL